MERESEYLLHLLGAWLREEEPRQEVELNWNALVQLAHMHNVSGILGYMAMTWPLCPDEKRNAALRSACMSTISRYSQRAALTERFSEDLTAHGIDHILMKGHVLRRYYPVPELRTFGDVDLVIRPDDREKCHSLMLNRGFQVKTDWEPVFSYSNDREFYELHTEILEVDVSDKADYRGYFRNLWSHVRQVGPHCYEFDPEYHFIYMMAHLAKHVSGSGAGARMYLDAAAFVRHFGADLDWQWVRRELKTLCLWEFADTVLAFSERYFGVASPFGQSAAADQTLEQLAEVTMRGGIFGRKNRDSGTNSLKDRSRGGHQVSRIGTVAKRLFPAAKTIETRYTYLQHRPWLLPAAWVHRLVKTRDSWQAHADEAQKIMSADLNEVQKITRFLEQIGL